MGINWNMVTAIGTCIAAIAALSALGFVYRQVLLISRTLQCQAYLKLADEWRDASLKEHVKSVLDIWKTWKADASTEGKDSDVENWTNFVNQRAKDWVDAHGND